MSNLNTYFKNIVSVCKKGFAYAKVVPVLIKAVYQRLVGNGYYEVAFTKIGRKWYCNVPGFPKELFEHTLMVGGASKFLEYYSRGENKIKATIKIANEMDDRHFCGSRLYKNSSTLTGGAFYRDPSGNFNEEIWLCPVTLFLLGKYPERILIYKINKNYLHCPIYIEWHRTCLIQVNFSTDTPKSSIIVSINKNGLSIRGGPMTRSISKTLSIA